MTLDRDYAGTGYASSASDIVRILNQAAEDKAYRLLDEELTDELQAESDKIRYGNAHKRCRCYHPPYERCSIAGIDCAIPTGSLPSCFLQKGCKRSPGSPEREARRRQADGLLMGRHLDARAVIRDDGRMFSRTGCRKADIAVALLVDEREAWQTATGYRRRGGSWLYTIFCRSLGFCPSLFTATVPAMTMWSCYAYGNSTRFRHKDKYHHGYVRPLGNRDGAALRYVAERLNRRRGRILILISDGQPADTDYYGTEAEADLRGIKREYTNKGILMFAAAIGDDKPNIQRIYKDGFSTLRIFISCRPT